MKLLKGILLQAFLAVLTILFFVALGELSVRLFHYDRDSRPFPSYAWFIEFDPNLGWKPPANQRHIYPSKDVAGATHEVHYSTGPHGFRSYGNVNSSNTKIMIVGDSYTQATDVSDDQTYYAKLKKNLSDRMPVEIFVYGSRGYGTLQEVMIVEQHIKEIKPDILILQVCANDFINNSVVLETKSTENNSRLLRPYLGSDGTITMQMPQTPFRKLVWETASYSRFLKWVIIRFRHWIAVNKVAHTVEDDIRAQSTANSEFMYAVTLTNSLLERLRSAVPAATKIYAFQANTVQPFSSEFEKLFPRHGIVYIEGVAEAVTNAFQKGEVVYAWDGEHWASAGHTIAAEVIANRLRAN
jgi:lysophospholipase L1-like esterase